MCVKAAQRRLALLFMTPPARCVPLTPDDLQEIAKMT